MKKIICMIITIALTLSIAAVNAAELNATELNPAELNESQIKDLYDLKIMVGDADGSLRLKDEITRAEAVKIICTAGNIEPVSEEVFSFPDVALDHWANPYIKAAKLNGITEGDENGYFNPEQNITNEEIVKMIVCLLGYDPMADASGGYPAGYTMVGTRFGITKGLSLDVSNPAIRNDVGIMICNALDIPLMAQNPDSDEEEYIIMDGSLYNKVTLRSRLVK